MTGSKDSGQIEECAARWLMRRDEPDWNAQEQAALDAWLDESMAHKAAYWRLDHGWRKAVRIAALGNAPVPVSKRRHWRGAWQAAAAAACIAAVAALVGYRLTTREAPAPQMLFATTVGGYQRIPLIDGSTLELNTATRLRAAVSDDKREVWLDQGEVYFEVFHARRNPFVVHAGARQIAVLGTKFSVRREDEKIVVAVVDGRVQINEASPAQEPRSIVIAGGDMAIALGESMTIVTNVAGRVANGLSWRDGIITFDGSTVAEAAAEFNRYSRRKVVVSDPRATSVKVSGTFRASNVEAFAYLLREAYGIQVMVQDEALLIGQ